MSEQLKYHLEQLKQASTVRYLGEVGHGIEKESLRVDPNGHIALSPHPQGLGASLTHPSITTDFSEALLEFITPVSHSPQHSLHYLEDLHSFVYSQLQNDEFLWTSSMPCILANKEVVPLALYGNSNIGRMKTLYREGLSHRYGRPMQTIAGIHYNFSLSDNFWSTYQRQLGSELSLQDFKTEQYFNLIRNFRRYSWLLIYLFGASPAVCKSFLKGHEGHGLEEYDEFTLYAPHGTSLRMGDLGYTSEANLELYISYTSLAEYTRGLDQAIRKPYPPYERFTRADGRLTQLNTSILQIENEFYSTIRPKRIGPSGSRPINVLNEMGVEYIEVRCLDLNPFLPVGIDEEQMCFLNSFLIFCLLEPSPPSDCDEYREIEANFLAVVERGREPGLQLKRGGQEITLNEWARDILQQSTQVAELLDTIGADCRHTEATRQQLRKVEDSALTPSARVLERMRESKTSFFRFSMDQSLGCLDYFRARQLDPDQRAEFTRQAQQSLRDKQDTEDADDVDFETFLKHMNES